MLFICSEFKLITQWNVMTDVQLYSECLQCFFMCILSAENARRALNTSTSSRGSLVSPRDRLSPRNKISPLPSRYSPLPSNRLSPRDRAQGGRNSPHSDKDSLRSRCDSGQGHDSGQGRESPSDSESYSSNLPRPRRRDHQFHDHKMKTVRTPAVK